MDIENDQRIILRIRRYHLPLYTVNMIKLEGLDSRSHTKALKFIRSTYLQSVMGEPDSLGTASMTLDLWVTSFMCTNELKGNPDRSCTLVVQGPCWHVLLGG